MHDLPGRRSRQPAAFLQAHRRGEGVCGSWAPTPGRAFGQLEYLTPPEHADMTIKEQALDRVQQPGTSPGHYRAPDTLLAFLDNL